MAVDITPSTLLEFAKTIDSEPQPTSKTRMATVTRIGDDGTPYVTFPDGTETPLAGTVSTMKIGDSVMVSMQSGKLRANANVSDPAASNERMTRTETTALAAAKAANAASIAADAAEYEAARAKDAADDAQSSANNAQASADAAANSLKSVVQGATTVEKAVSVMQTALEAVIDYDPLTDTTTEYFWHDANGAHVLGDTSGYRNDIDSSGMSIKEVSTEDVVASFGTSGAQIGKVTSGNYVILDDDSFNLYHAETSGSTTMTTEMVHFGYGDNGYGTYAPYYTLGSRDSLTVNGNYSVVIGPGGTASDSRAVAIGNSAKATASNSLGIGTNATASGMSAIAIGSNAISSGSHTMSIGTETTASGYYTTALGYKAQASGNYSHAQGMNTVASSNYQTALGKYNVEDANGVYAVIVGNGTADNARSNALTLDWNGVLYVANGYMLPNGSQIWDNTNRIIHMQTPDAGTAQAEFTFEPDGKIYSRKRTRSSAGASWGSWSSWTAIAG